MEKNEKELNTIQRYYVNMGIRNTSGIKIQCKHCGYTWFYAGEKDVTSCPKCGWRVRIRPARRISTPAGDALTRSRRNERLI